MTARAVVPLQSEEKILTQQIEQQWLPGGFLEEAGPEQRLGE